MKYLLTEADRKRLTALAWQMVRREPAPRHVRLLMRDKLVLQWLAEQEARGWEVPPSSSPDQPEVAPAL